VWWASAVRPERGPTDLPDVASPVRRAQYRHAGRAAGPAHHQRCRRLPLDLLDALERLEVEHPELISAFVLRDLSELEYADIARHLDVPVGTVKARIHHARRYVRASLAGGAG
jgi:DNA-directed RNA polymerase specialized sigma24 family protein